MSSANSVFNNLEVFRGVVKLRNKEYPLISRKEDMGQGTFWTEHKTSHTRIEDLEIFLSNQSDRIEIQGMHVSESKTLLSVLYRVIDKHDVSFLVIAKSEGTVAKEIVYSAIESALKKLRFCEVTVTSFECKKAMEGATYAEVSA